MAFAREWFPSDTLKLINQSEGLLVRNGMRSTPGSIGVDDSYGAHAVGSHLLKGAPGALGGGIEHDAMANRFLNSPTDGSGNAMLNSAWKGKGEMALLLCELLNSAIGQLALRAMDKGARRAVVHYLNLGKLAALYNIGGNSLKMQQSRIHVTPPSEILVEKTFTPKTGPAIIKQIKQKLPGSKKAQLEAVDVACVNAVLDRYGDKLHLQTLFPSSEAAASYAEWSFGGVKIIAVIDNGKVMEKLVPIG
jgi:hypothetical protein